MSRQADTRAGRHADKSELTYEGFPLESVLGRVFGEQGPDATITSAERVRKGGIGGFFAQAVFQVTVTVPTVASAPAAPTAPISIFGVDHQVPAAAVIPEQIDYDEIDPEDIEGALELEIVAERSPEDQSIWELLAERVRSQVEPTESGSVETDAFTDALAATMQSPVGALPSERPRTDHLLAAQAVGRNNTSEVEIVKPILATGPIATTHVINASRTGAKALRMPLVSTSSTTDHGRNSRRVDLPATDRVAPVVPLRPHLQRRTFGPGFDLNDLIAEFAAVSADHPTPPHMGVIAVVGVRDHALDVAAGLATELGIHPNDVVIAAPVAPIVIPTQLESTRLAAAARYRCKPVAIVVVELVPGRIGHEWARAVLNGLRAEQVRFAVSADRPVAQQRLTIAALGGVDALDLMNVTDCPNPEHSLDLGIPIVTIDGRPATPEMWAATVLAAHHRSDSMVDHAIAGAR